MWYYLKGGIFLEQGIYTGRYIGKEICGFKKDHKYCFEVKHNGRTYQLRAFNDELGDLEKDLYIDYSNENSIRKNWIIDEEE